MKKYIPESFLLIFFCLAFGINASGQAPVIIYSTPQVYTTGTAITPLSPTNTGGAVGSYATPVSFGNNPSASNDIATYGGNFYSFNNSTGAFYAFNSAGTAITNSYTTAVSTLSLSGTSPQSIIFDALGNMYFSVFSIAGQGRVYKVTPSGAIGYATTTANGPIGLTVDAANNVYFANQSASAIYKIAANGTSGTTGAVTTAATGFSQPWGVLINSNGDLYVSDTNTNIIYKVPSGSSTGTAFASGLSSPRNMKFDAAGNLTVADCFSNSIKKITPGGIVTTVVSGLSNPTGVAYDAAGNLYMSAYGSSTLLKSTATYYSISPGLPAGLSFNTLTGVISGTPTAASAATNYTVTAYYGTASTTTTVVNISVGTPNTTSGWYANYVYREKITLSKTLVSGSADLKNFPVLIKVIDANLIYLPGSCTNKIQSPVINDLAFTDATSGQTVELAYQIDSYDNTTGTLFVWVKVPTLAASGSATAATAVYLYYGNTAPPISHTTTYQQTTWNGTTSAGVNYNGVWHFNEAPSTSTATLTDGTSAGVNLISASTTAVTQNSSSLIANGVNLNGSTVSSNTTITTYPQNGNSQPITLSCWANYSVNPSSPANVMVLGIPGGGLIQMGFPLQNYNLSSPLELVGVWPAGNRQYAFGYRSASFPSTNTWHNYTYSFNGTSGVLYIDGVAQTTTSYSPNNNGSQGSAFNSIIFGSYGGGFNENFIGAIDEAHFIGTALSSDWIKTEYNNQLNPFNSGTSPFITAIATIEYNLTNFNAGYSPGSMVYTWNGSYSTNIQDSGNWSLTSVPATAQGYPGTTSQPQNNYASIIIGGGYTATLIGAYDIYSVTLASSASKFNLAGYTLGMGCDINNSSGGQIIYSANNNSKITWKGSLASQNYYGSTTAATGQTGDMEVNNSAAGTVNISGGYLDVYDLLTMTKGNLAVASSGTLTLKSNSSGTASVGAIPSTSSITGNVNVERYFKPQATGMTSDNTRGYRLLSSPVNNNAVINNSGATATASLAYVSTGLYTAGPTGTGGGFTQTNATPFLYLYKESLPTTSGTGFNTGTFKGITNLNSLTVFNDAGTAANATGTSTYYPGNGFLLFYAGSNTTGTASVSALNKVTRYGGSYMAPDAATATATGTLNQGAVPVKLWWNGSTTLSNVQTGYNLAGNPYASTIDLNTFSATTSTSGIYGPGVANTFYVYNYASKNYSTFQIGVGATGNGSNLIASGQGFYVKASTGATLTFNEAAKTATQPVPTSPTLLMGLPAATAQSQSLRLRLAKDSVNTDDIIVVFDPEAKNGYEPYQDADRLGGIGNIATLASYAAGSAVPLAINHMHSIDPATRIRLYASVTGNTSPDTLLVTGTSTLDSRYDLYLIDRYKKDSLLVSKYPRYLFSINPADTASYGANRFELVFHKKNTLNYRLISFTALPVSGGIQLTWKTENEQDLTGFQLEREDGSKQFFSLHGLQSDGSGTYTYLDQAPLSGTNYYRLRQDDAFEVVTYSSTLAVNKPVSAAAAVNAITVYPNPVTSEFTVALNTAIPARSVLRVTDSNGRRMLSREFSGSSVQQYVSNFLPGTYIVEVSDPSGKGVIGTAKFLKK